MKLNFFVNSEIGSFIENLQNNRGDRGKLASRGKVDPLGK